MQTERHSVVKSIGAHSDYIQLNMITYDYYYNTLRLPVNIRVTVIVLNYIHYIRPSRRIYKYLQLRNVSLDVTMDVNSVGFQNTNAPSLI